ncbi:membrane fusion protein, cobalt-zinc-cadmium efflux system [Nitrosomonas marina]|uniref:Membrane fusion protein, cobalt-zinc-cadmium efflux system n=1 Tax=Nitrosomonas marina TaxID=917 RepID=A0A1H9Y6V6_9PROT|nr:efflux RND transporter periplasmic adaptor subunit [Nitrosomonas marina]SES64155.1 membrane fusion protein, cobalt-zinc-cadmium efflux system [Nitrosomonas marina]
MSQYKLSLLAYLMLIILSVSGCYQQTYDRPAPKAENGHKHHHSDVKEFDRHSKTDSMHMHQEINEVHLSELMLANLDIRIDTLPVRSLSGKIKVNGRLALFPQHRATVTAILGANVTAIEVIEGEKVHKGQVLAYLSHPNLTNLQAAYIRVYNQMQFLKKEYLREEHLFEAGVGSAKAFQQAKADYLAMKGEIAGYEAQLVQLNIDARQVRTGKILQSVPVVSPIDGNIEKVLIQLGQFVDPNATLFMIMNLEHIHADLMVFEKNVSQVREGQQVSFRVESLPGKTISARIFAVGKNFEQTPRAVHVHAEIEQKHSLMIPGMYISGEIHIENSSVTALPESAVVTDDGKSFIFSAEPHRQNGKMEWIFRPVEVRTGISDDGWIELFPVESFPDNAKVAWNNAYYLIAEINKSETSHAH